MKMKREVKPFNADYRLIKTLGNGQFGEVHLVEDQQGKQFALKVLQNTPKAQAEIQINQKLTDNRPVVSQVAPMPFKTMTVDYEGKIYRAEGFVGPYITYQQTNASGEWVAQSHTLEQFIHGVFHQDNPSLKASKAIEQAFVGPKGAQILEQIATGIHEAHHELAAQRIIWGDLAPRNLMTTVEYNTNGEVVAIKPVAIDFGVSIALNENDHSQAPTEKTPRATTHLEAYKTGKLNAKTDIFAKKVTMIALITALFTETDRKPDTHLYHAIDTLKTHQAELYRRHALHQEISDIHTEEIEREFLTKSLIYVDELIQKSPNEPLKKNARLFLHPFKTYLLSEPPKAERFEDIVQEDKILYEQVANTFQQTLKHVEANPEATPTGLFDDPVRFVPTTQHPLQRDPVANVPPFDDANVSHLVEENALDPTKASDTATKEVTPPPDITLSNPEPQLTNSPDAQRIPSLFKATIRGMFTDALEYVQHSRHLPLLLINKALELVQRAENAFSQISPSEQANDFKHSFNTLKATLKEMVQPREETHESKTNQQKP